MATKMVTETAKRITCDHCGGSAYDSDRCQLCGKDWCWSCQEAGRAVELNEGVFFKSSSDKTWCASCDREDKSERHEAYAAIRALREEYKSWHEAFKVRQDAAEARVRKVNEKARAARGTTR